MRVNIYAEGTDKRAVRCEGGRRRYVRRGRMDGNCLVLRVNAFVYVCRGNMQEGAKVWGRVGKTCEYRQDGGR